MPLLRHLVCVRAAYGEESLSRTRLELSAQTIIPALRNQSSPYKLCLRINGADPLLSERLELFRSLDVEIQHDLEGGPGLTLWSRIDDDDAVADDYLTQVRRAADGGAEYVGFPKGLIADGRIWNAHISGNMFGSAVGPSGWHIFQENHRQLLHKRRRTAALLSDSSAWLWVRHGTTKTRALARYRTGPGSLPEHRYCGVDIKGVA